MQKTKQKLWVFGMTAALLLSLATAAGCNRYGIGFEDLTLGEADDASEQQDTTESDESETSDGPPAVDRPSDEVDSVKGDLSEQGEETEGEDSDPRSNDAHGDTDRCTCVCSCEDDSSPSDTGAAPADVDADTDTDTDTNADADSEMDTESAESTVPTDRDGTECVIISEYLEGSSWNKGIEIFNCGRGDVSLEDYSLCVAANDAVECSGETALSGQLKAGDVATVCHTGFEEGACDLWSGVINFSGDDRVALFQGGVLVDSFGRLSVRPEGAPWADVTLKRCNTEAYSGDGPFEVTDFYVAADKDDFSDFGLPPSASSCP